MALKKSAGFAFIWGDKILLSHATGAAWRFYSIIKGQQEEGENFLETALREVKEEANIELSPELMKQVENRPPDFVIQNKAKVLTGWFIRINAPEEIGMQTTYDKHGKLHTIIEKEKLQDNEIDWAGFVDFKDAEKRIAPYQLPILEQAKRLQEIHQHSKFLKEHIIVARPGLMTPEQTSVKITKVPTDAKSVSDYDISGHPRIYRIKTPAKPAQGDLVNIYYDDSSKGGLPWRGSVEAVIAEFDKSPFFKKTTSTHLPGIDSIEVTLPKNEKPWFTPEAELFVPFHQLDFLKELDDEGLDEYREVFERINRIVATMPKTYEEDETEYEDKTIYLHYFYSSGDWWILEKDKGSKDDAPEDRGKQLQVFCIANLNGAADMMGGGLGELGYVSIEELREIQRVELDFYFEPIKVSNLISKKGKSRSSQVIEPKESNLSRAIRTVKEGVGDLIGRYDVSQTGEYEWSVYSKEKNRSVFFIIKRENSIVEFKVKGPIKGTVNKLAGGSTSIANDQLRQWVIDIANENLEKDFEANEQTQAVKPEEANPYNIIPGADGKMNFGSAYHSIAEAIEKNTLHVENSDSFEFKLLMDLLRAGFSVDVLNKEFNQPNIALLEKDGVELKLEDTHGELKIFTIKHQSVATLPYNKGFITTKELIDKVIQEANIKVNNWRNK